jgi:3-hydroxyisobutyrate dehydrogenase-like beta-hydroxyacid dehydrogenase
MLLAGPHAQSVAPLMNELGMQVKIAGDKIGAAAAIKMIRSVMIKGIEALSFECFVAASRAGLLDEVTVSLKNNYPGLDWVKMSEYNIERMASHGERRAAEMEESALTLRELGLDPLMTDAMVLRHREMGTLGKTDAVREAKTQGRDALLDAVSEAKRNA